MAAVTICSNFGAQENKICHCFHFFPFCLREVMGPDAMILVFYMLDIKLAFFSIQKTKIMASGPITSWQIDWETMETVADFIFLGSKITADRDFSH